MLYINKSEVYNMQQEIRTNPTLNGEIIKTNLVSTQNCIQVLAGAR